MNKKNNFTIMRSLACLLIVNHHMGHFFNVPVLTPLSRCGHVIVTVFFVLSGYLLTIHTEDRRVDLEWLKKRLLRIYPSLIISILVGYAIYIIFRLGDKIAVKDLLLYASGFHYFLNSSKFMPHLWFISVILLCYLLFKPAKYLIKKRPAIYFCILIVTFCIFARFTSISSTKAALTLNNFKGNLYYRLIREIPLRFLYSFTVFSLSIYYAQREQKIRITKSIKAVCVFILPIVSLALYAYSFSVMEDDVILNVICILSAFLCTISFCIVVSSITYILEKVLFVFEFIANISYEIYIIHYIIVLLALKYVPTYFSHIFVYSISILLAAVIHRMANTVIHTKPLLKPA